RHGEDVLAADVQRLAARHQLPQLETVSKELGHRRPGHRHLLEVVEEKQHLLPVYLAFELLEQRSRASLPQADGPSRDRKRRLQVAARSEVDEVDPVLELLAEVGRRLQGEAGLAAAARAHEREQAGLGQPSLDLFELVLPSDEAVESGREVAGRGAERLEGRKRLRQSGGDDLPEMVAISQAL